MKERIRKTHDEERLQVRYGRKCSEFYFLVCKFMLTKLNCLVKNILITTDELRKRCLDFRANNFNNKKLQKAIRSVLNLPVP